MKDLKKTKQLIGVLLKKDLDSDTGKPITDSEIKSVIEEMESIIFDKKMFKIIAYFFSFTTWVLLLILVNKL